MAPAPSPSAYIAHPSLTHIPLCLQRLLPWRFVAPAPPFSPPPPAFTPRHTPSRTRTRSRYGRLSAPLRPIFSEYGLIRFRVLVECRWLQQLSRIPEVTEVPAFSPEANAVLDRLCTQEGFTVEVAQQVATRRGAAGGVWASS